MTPSPIERDKVTRRWVSALMSILIALILFIGGMGLTAAGISSRATLTRGFTNAATTPNLPYRVPRAGVNIDLRPLAEDPAALRSELDAIARAGFIWIRQSFYWDEIEPARGSFDFAKYDAILNALNDYPTLKLLAVLDSAPSWARRPEASDRLFAPPKSPAEFATFASTIAARYGKQIDHYQIWDEPNLNMHWGGLEPRPADYVALLRAANTAIKGADAGAFIIAAGLAPTTEDGPRNLSDTLYLKAMYEAGGKGSFDAAAGKPYGFTYPPTDRTTDPALLNFSRLVLLREIMEQYGDSTTPLWASHFGWNSLPTDWQGTPSIWGRVTPDEQAEYTRSAYERAEREWTWAGAMFLAFWKPNAPPDDPIQGFDVSGKAADWFTDGAFFKGLTRAIQPGYHAPTDPRMAYMGDWRFGDLGADVELKPGRPEPPEDGNAHTLKFTFRGDSLAFNVRRNDQVAFIYIRVDDQPANALPLAQDKNGGYIILKSPELEQTTELIPVATGLDPDRDHTVEARFYLGYQGWVLAGVGIGSTPDTTGADRLTLLGSLLMIAGLVIGVIGLRRLPHEFTVRFVSGLFGYLRRSGLLIGGLLVSVLGAISVALTLSDLVPSFLRRDAPSIAVVILTMGIAYFAPYFVIALASFAVLFVIIYNRPVIGLALIVFWSPFFLIPYTLYRFDVMMVELMLGLTLGAVILRTVVDARRGFRFGERLHLLDYVMIAFVLLAIGATVWSDLRIYAIRELRVIIIEPVIFYFLIRRLKLTTTDYLRIVDALILAGLAVALLGLWSFITGNAILGIGNVVIAEAGSRRLVSVYGSPNNAALFMGRVLPFCAAMVLFTDGRLSSTRRIFAAGVGSVILFAIVLTQSAGSLILGLPAALLTLFFLWRPRWRLIGVGLIIVGIIGLLGASRFVPRLQGIFDLSRSSSLARTQIWTSTIQLLEDRPVTGAGLDQFLYLYRSRYILPDAWREPNHSHPHNVVLNYWVSLGVGGVLILIAQQFGFWRLTWGAFQHFRIETGSGTRLALLAGAMGSMAYFLAHGIVDNSYFVIDLAYVFCLIMALAAGYNHREEATENR